MQYTLIAYDDFERKSIAYTIVFDAVMAASESYTNQITTFTVEDGGIVTDHAIKNKDKITIEGIVTDLSFNQGEEGLAMFLPDGSIQATRTESWSRKTKQALLNINEALLPCSFKVSYKFEGVEYIESDTFPCLIESLNLDQSGGQYGFIQPKITLVPIRLARLEFEKLTGTQEAIPALKNENTNSSNAKLATGSTDGKDASSDGKEVDLDLTKTPEQPKENASMISEMSTKAKSLADTVIKSEIAVTQAQLNKIDAKIAKLESGK